MADAQPDRHPAYSDPAAKAALLESLFEAMAMGTSVNTFSECCGVPHGTLRMWAQEDEATAARYMRARELQADYFVERAEEVAEAAKGAKSSEEASAYRLLVDTLKWKAAKFHRNRYGEGAVFRASAKEGGEGGSGRTLTIEVVQEG